ncbi:MAG: hypothetical protein KIT84_30975 [Labilithrix sp.]|nr:hypothetical protein [Labilithrix sp.]MCW5815492.1 hypothetical protein [Labilithrix sp.]
MSSHAIVESRSLALHRAVAARLLVDERVLERARSRVATWRREGGVHPRYCAEWEHVLTGSPAEVAAFLERDDEHARALRQASPFAGALDARERWQILRSM